MTELLVSVRSAAEAQVALAGGAALIDVKEPARGALGRADDDTIGAVIEAVAGRCPVSAALGELAHGEVPVNGRGLSFVKWGLAGCSERPWRQHLSAYLNAPLPCTQGRGVGVRDFGLEQFPQTVIVAYADWQCAAAPPVDDVAAFACEQADRVLLIDTYCKDAARLSLRRRPTLLDWLTVADVVEITDRCREANVRVALAGSLGAAEIDALRGALPDWFAVRGAVCADSERGGAIELAKVRALAEQLNGAAATSAG